MPNQTFLRKDGAPLLERIPLLSWKGVSLVLALVFVCLLVT